jgi:hypothetical protein
MSRRPLQFCFLAELCGEKCIILEHMNVGRGSSVGTATRYGLNGLGIESR